MKYLIYTTKTKYDYETTILRLTLPNKFLVIYSLIHRKRFSKKILDFLFIAYSHQTQRISSSGIRAESLAENINKTKKLGTMRRILEEAELGKVKYIYTR